MFAERVREHGDLQSCACKWTWKKNIAVAPGWNAIIYVMLGSKRSRYPTFWHRQVHKASPGTWTSETNYKQRDLNTYLPHIQPNTLTLTTYFIVLDFLWFLQAAKIQPWPSFTLFKNAIVSNQQKSESGNPLLCFNCWGEFSNREKRLTDVI